MRRIGDEDLLRIAPLRMMVSADHHQTDELALGARGGMKRDAIHAADRRERFLEAVHQLERALRLLIRSQRMKPRKPRQTSRPLIHLGVVFHRAGAERIHPRIDREVLLAQADIMTNDLGLKKYGQQNGSAS